jgi:cysteine-rich repeat protein
VRSGILLEMRRARLVPLLAVFAGCVEPYTTTGGGSTGVDAGSSGSTASAPGSTGTTDDPTGGGSTGEPGFDPPPPVCGDGYLEADEECDDGNVADGDGCSATCTILGGLQGQVLALAPSGLSDLWVASVAAAPDGGFVAVAHQREITSDQEGNQDIGLVRTRVIRYGPDLAPVWDRLLAPDDAALAAGSGVVDALGDIYVAATVDGPDGDDIHVSKLAGDDGEAIWAVTHDGALDMSDDGAGGIALAPDGDIVVTGRVYDVAKDSDVWVRKLQADDGGEVWTTTWTGAGNGEYSIDRAGGVAVAADGTVYVAAREYVDLNTAEAVLLRFAAAGGPAQQVFSPLSDGSEHEHGPGWVSVDPAGNVLYSIIRQSGATPNFWLYKLDSNLEIQWTKQLPDFEDEGDEWVLAGNRFDAGGGVMLAGHSRTKDTMAQLEWFDIWTARLDPAGDKLCQVHYAPPAVDLVPPSLFGLDVAAAQDGVALVGGQQVQNGEQQLWVGLFRPQ